LNLVRLAIFAFSERLAGARDRADDIADQSGGMGGMMQDLAFAIPGVDEAMGFAEIMKYVFTFPSPKIPRANKVDMSNQWNSQ
jgi:hypothetical protein